MAEILIIGANPTGLILANILAERGVSTKVIDQRDSLESPGLSGFQDLPIMLSCSSLELLDNADLLSGLEGEPFYGVHYHWRKRTVLFKFNQSTDSRYASTLLTTYKKLTQHLIHKLEERGGYVSWATRPVTLVDDNIFIESTRTPQSFENREVHHPKWVIACEVDHDPDIRDLFKNHVKARKYNKDAIFVRCHELQNFDKDYVHMLPGVKNLVNLVFCHQENWEFFIANHSVFPSLKLKQKLQRNYHLDISENYQAYKITYYQYPFNQAQFLFVGSVAHNLTFSYLSGANHNIHSAFNLGWKLVPVLKQVASCNLVTTVEQKSCHTLPYLSDEKLAKKLLFSQYYKPALVYCYLKGCRQFGSSNGEFYYSPNKALRYEQSALIRMSSQDKEIRGPRPGMRALDFCLEDGSYLLDALRGTKHLLIFFKERPDLQQALLEEYGDWINVVVVKDPRIFKLYYANPETLFIIRPDRYIGYRTHMFKLHELISYLLRIFSPENLSKT